MRLLVPAGLSAVLKRRYGMRILSDKKTRMSLKKLWLVVVPGLVLMLFSLAHADDPMRLVMNGTWQTAVHHYYVGQDVPGYRWDIYLKDYYNDEWRMKKVRDYGGVEYYVGNRYVPSNGKRYASSASVFHSNQGDVISFSSQNWQKEKTFTYNMIRQNDYRMYGCEYWVGMDRWDNFYMRNAWIELQSGEFGGKTR